MSPKNREEALSALEGGADIIDVKNPKEGALGANFPWIISKIRDSIPSKIKISAAIGDFPNLPGSASLAVRGALDAGADIVKVGIREPEELEEVTYFMKKATKSLKEASKSAKIVACGYGDYKRSGTVKPGILLEAAQESDADIAMLDTLKKDGKPLTDFLSLKKLKEFVEDAHSRGLQASLAGSLGIEEIQKIKDIHPDIIGVRGAVCEGKDRKNNISESLVRNLKENLEG